MELIACSSNCAVAMIVYFCQMFGTKSDQQFQVCSILSNGASNININMKTGYWAKNCKKHGQFLTSWFIEAPIVSSFKNILCIYNHYIYMYKKIWFKESLKEQFRNIFYINILLKKKKKSYWSNQHKMSYKVLIVRLAISKKTRDALKIHTYSPPPSQQHLHCLTPSPQLPALSHFSSCQKASLSARLLCVLCVVPKHCSTAVRLLRWPGSAKHNQVQEIEIIKN